ncbi:MAG: adenosylcobinamide-GDP ribazoletransferase [Candidatus Methanomethylicaceae archaeon]
MGAVEGLRAALSFLTVLPVGSGNIDEMARHAYFFPLVGALIGVISGGLGFLLFHVLPSLLAGLLTLLVLLLITGLYHLDGVLDLGDALMFRGDREERLEILHDKNHGIGGLTALYFSLTITVATIALIGERILPALIMAESYGKLSMVIGGFLGRPHTKGIGSRFISKMREGGSKILVLGIAISAMVNLALGLPVLMALVLFFVSLFSIVWTRCLISIFGCITGDMLGCMNEISRLISLFLFLICGVR